MLPTQGPHASRPDYGKLPTRKTQSPEEETQKTHSSFTVNLKPYLWIKSKLTTININIQRVNN